MPAEYLDSSNPNSLWCSVVAETLVRTGVCNAVISPGSRSTPLTFALVSHPGMSCTPVLDERSAAFFALGMAKRTGRPVVLVCTSGTAGANYLPAVIEARESGVPLLILTADRPPEMRACASGQTIDQQKLFGDHVLFFHVMAVPEASHGMLAYARQMMAQAVERSLWPVAGPVHLNCPFRDPLHPEKTGDQAALAARISSADFWEHLSPMMHRLEESSPVPLFSNERGVIVAGPMPEGENAAEHTAAVAALSRALGWPVLADALSQLRQFPADCPALITHYDAVLRSEALASRLRPAQALLIGALPTSKALRSWLGAEPCPRLYQVSGFPESRDPLHGRTSLIRRSAGSLAACLGGAPHDHSDYVRDWSRASTAARLHIDNTLGPERSLVEPKAAWLLGQMGPRGGSLVVANSMPVRDLEYVWGSFGRRLRVFFNRGANGIDGTLSTAFGVAHNGDPTLLLTGDLSFLHDSNGLLLNRRLRGSLTIVVVDNAGGGIFGHLAVARYEPPFEEYFATPQQVDFSSLAAAHNIPCHTCATWEELAEHLRQLPPSGVRILLLKTERRADAALRKTLFAGAALAAERALG